MGFGVLGTSIWGLEWLLTCAMQELVHAAVWGFTACGLRGRGLK